MPATRRPIRPVYVETRIRAPMDVLWDLTQTPHEHQRWDARFTRIRYGASAHAEEGAGTERPAAIRFRYRLGPPGGPALTGTGITTAERCRPDGSRISALRFVADNGLSPLQEGSGYWRYVPAASPSGGTVRFVTGYDYRSWGWPGGALVDRWFVRPVVGWLTAWSFDRLRLWAERGIPPERARLHAVAETGARLGAPVAAALLTAAAAGPVVGTACGGVVLLLSALLPPSPVTPAARRCARRPDRNSPALSTRRPRLLNALETP
ncbi:hypothetical protein ACIBJD_38485 [Kitasatospora sp. NPDC050467]|uniref:hypothetical protein n=1 Tax=Kitasatospora sp. NPDC050467 TaxID=3364053 RepID=UPI00379CE048